MAPYDYDYGEQEGLQPFLAVAAVAASLRSCDHESGTWQMACNYKNHSTLRSHYHHLQPSLLATNEQSPWESQQEVSNGDHGMLCLTATQGNWNYHCLGQHGRVFATTLLSDRYSQSQLP